MRAVHGHSGHTVVSRPGNALDADPTLRNFPAVGLRGGNSDHHNNKTEREPRAGEFRPGSRLLPDLEARGELLQCPVPGPVFLTLSGAACQAERACGVEGEVSGQLCQGETRRNRPVCLCVPCGGP